MVRTWEREGWRTLKDLLIHYNQLDVHLFVQAVQKLLEPYLKDGFDIKKNSFYVNGAAKLKMLKAIEPNSFFCPFPKRHADLYKALRAQLTAGLSIVFSRLDITGETKIRPHQIKDPETCQKSIGLDSNSLYLYVIQQENPTGYFVRYKESENFKPNPCFKFGWSAYQ